MSSQGLYTREQMISAYKAGQVASAAGFDDKLSVRWVEAQDPVKLIGPLDGRCILALPETMSRDDVISIQSHLIDAARAAGAPEGRADQYIPVIVILPTGTPFEQAVAHYEDEMNAAGWVRSAT